MSDVVEKRERNDSYWLAKIIKAVNFILEDVHVDELMLSNEQVLLFYPTVSSLDKELREVQDASDIEAGGHYFLTIGLRTDGIFISLNIRFYLMDDWTLDIKDVQFGEAMPLVGPEDGETDWTNFDEVWQVHESQIESALNQGKLIAKMLFACLGLAHSDKVSSCDDDENVDRRESECDE